MILLFGRIADPIVASLCARLAARSADLLVVDPGHAESGLPVDWVADHGVLDGTVSIGARVIDASDIRSMFIREVRIKTHQGRGCDDRLSGFRTENLFAMMDAFPGLVINRREACSTNASKPYQLALIRQQGFRVPHTLVTTDPQVAKQFWDHHQGNVIYKSISAERSIVKRMVPDDLQRLDCIRFCPVQLQEAIPGVDVRVHVVGERVFATEVRSAATDYRYAGEMGEDRVMRPVELPSEVAERCVALARHLGLVLTGIDLRRLPTGEYCCFEANPSPAYLWFEEVTGQRISEAIADLLCSGTLIGSQHGEGGHRYGEHDHSFAATIH